MFKCEWCGYEGDVSEFRYLSLAEEMGPNTYRQCPKCNRAVYCEELEFDSLGEDVWGTGGMRGQVFSRRSSKDKKGSGGKR
ncbi:MAG: hypothetical protein KAT75_00570 [Dehalococcoidia bacterium]|nr:hypothetical protein [Dehalococcoidia bacterium]